MEYEVLYYNRTKKIHKAKGVSKSDGFLRISRDDGMVVLRSASIDNGGSTSSDEESDHGRNSKRKRKRSHKTDNDILFSGRIMSLAKETLMEEQTVVVGGYEVQIVTVVGKDVAIKPITTKNEGSGTSSNIPRSSARVGGLKSVRMTPKHDGALLPAHKPVPPRFVNRNKKLESSSQRRVLSRTNSNLPTSSVHRISPKQPSLVPVPSTKPTVLPHIPLPASIRATLRPHQIDGVDFMWNSLGGSLKGGE